MNGVLQSVPLKVSAPGTGPVRLVLDTNVSLDLLVFRDPRWRALHRQIEDGVVEVVMRADCRAEFIRVLDYPQFALSPTQQARVLDAFDALYRLLPADGLESPEVTLPRCADPDDQKFLELALAAGAQALLSKDKALLKLARRNRRAGLFAILTPQDWLERATTVTPEA